MLPGIVCLLMKTNIVRWFVCVIRSWMNVKALNFKYNTVQHHHQTLRTSIHRGGKLDQMARTGVSLISQRHRPPASNSQHGGLCSLPYDAPDPHK